MNHKVIPLVTDQKDIQTELLAALEAATREILGDRDCLYDSITDGEGNIVDPSDAEGLAELDALLDRCNAAIARAKGAAQ